MKPVHTTKYRNHTIEIHHDNDSESPREWCPFGKMICFHRRYNLGDKHKLTIEETKEIAEQSDVVCLPLYLYDHSGITMRCSPFFCPWDSGQVGIIYATHADIIKECGDASPESITKAIEMLKNEVSSYDDYLTGNCWGYVIKDAAGNETDSCWGFLGDQEFCISEAKSVIDWSENKRVEETANYVCGE